MKFTNEISDLVYQEYLDIEPKAHQERIRFFEANRGSISKLERVQRLEMSIEYEVSLFEVGDYYKYLKNVDQLLTICIQDNIYSIDGDDIYQELLFKKACALHNVLDFYGADHVFSELVKIDKTHKIYQIAYLKNKVSQFRYEGQKVRTFTIGILLLTGLVIGIELLIIRPLFEAYITPVELLRIGMFVVAVGSILFQEGYIRYRAYRGLKLLLK